MGQHIPSPNDIWQIKKASAICYELRGEIKVAPNLKFVFIWKGKRRYLFGGIDKGNVGIVYGKTKTLVLIERGYTNQDQGYVKWGQRTIDIENKVINIDLVTSHQSHLFWRQCNIASHRFKVNLRSTYAKYINCCIKGKIITFVDIICANYVKKITMCNLHVHF